MFYCFKGKAIVRPLRAYNFYIFFFYVKNKPFDCVSKKMIDII